MSVDLLLNSASVTDYTNYNRGVLEEVLAEDIETIGTGGRRLLHLLQHWGAKCHNGLLRIRLTFKAVKAEQLLRNGAYIPQRR